MTGYVNPGSPRADAKMTLGVHRIDWGEFCEYKEGGNERRPRDPCGAGLKPTLQSPELQGWEAR